MRYYKFFCASKKILISLFLACAVFFNLANLSINFWEQPARIMILAFVVFVPILAWLLFSLEKNLESEAAFISRKRLVSLAATSLVLGLFLTLTIPHDITTTFIIEPQISGSQSVEILEVKANGHKVPISDFALGYNWEIIDGGVLATSSSRPLMIKSRMPPNASISILFRTSPESGNALVVYGKDRNESVLSTLEDGEAIYSFSTRYRFFPNWLFLPLLLGSDLIAITFYALLVFILQEKGHALLTQENKVEAFFSHQVGLGILLAVGGVLHLINALSVPLILGVDSPSFLRGAVHLVENGNFDGVSMFRGPGTTLLFAPVVALFGRNPWGIKTLLHLMGIAIVGLNYRLAWQLSDKRWIGFLAAFITMLIPDIYFFSNYLMSDLPNIFFISLFSTLLVSAMQSFRKIWVVLSLLTASFAVLLRSENLALLALGIAALALPLFLEKIQLITKKPKDNGASKVLNRKISMLALATFLALLPVLWWSAHNIRNHGFFGMSNYAGEVFYTGWIYYGEASGYKFTDQNSSAVQTIQSAVEKFPIKKTDSSGVPTGWILYPSLTSAGFSSTQAFELMSQAARDSILNNPPMAWEILRVKLLDGLTPRPTNMITFNLPNEPERERVIEQQFFDAENLRISWLIQLQRLLYSVTQKFFDSIYQILIWIGLLSAFFCLQRKPLLVWGSVVLIMLTRIFIPDVMGKSDWRYTISGLVLMATLIVNCLVFTAAGIKSIFKKIRVA